MTTIPSRLRLDTPLHVAQALPYLLGYHPQDSLVVIAADGARSPLAQVVLDFDAATNIAAMNRVVEGLLPAKPDRIYAVVIADVRFDPERLPFRDIAHEVEWWTEHYGLIVGDVLLLSRNRLYSYTCENEACCPRLGLPVPARLYGLAATS